jgi:CubicO group peptidase (beta-lactamase class C family)
MSKILKTSLLLVLFFGCKKNDMDPIRTDNPKLTQTDRLVDDVFQPYFSKRASAGASIAIIDGSKVSRYHYGETRKGSDRLPDNETLYEIGSITKTFTAATLVYWCDQKGIDINTPIKNYLPPGLSPHLALNGTDVTFRQLLNHTSGIRQLPSGFPNNTDPYNGLDSNYLFNYISNNVVLTKTPGTLPATEQEAYNNYSNLAYSLPGLLLEHNERTGLQAVMQNALFNEYGMASTSFSAIENSSNRAYPHNNANNASYWHLTGFQSAGGLKSNLNDLIRYVEAQLSASNATAFGSAMLRCQTPTVAIGGKNIYALGWECYYTTTGKMLIVKDGGTGGFTSFIAFDRPSQKAIIALFNNATDNNPSDAFINLLEAFFK